MSTWPWRRLRTRLVSYTDESGRSGGGAHWTDFQVTGAGIQAPGEWPVFDMLRTPEALGRVLGALGDSAAKKATRDLRRVPRARKTRRPCAAYGPARSPVADRPT